MTAALEGGEWSAARPGHNLPPGKTRYQFYRRLGGSQGRSGRAENLVTTRIRSRTVQPVVSRIYPVHCVLLWTRPNQSTYTLVDSKCTGCFCFTPGLTQFTAFMYKRYFIHPIPQYTVRISNIKKVSLAKPYQPNVVSEVTSWTFSCFV